MGIAPPISAKLRGGYYTPLSVAQWLARWAIRSGTDRILEPSCGDGAFLAAAMSALENQKTLWALEPDQITATPGNTMSF